LVLLNEKIGKVKGMTHESHGRIRPLSISVRRTLKHTKRDTVSEETQAAISRTNIRTSSNVVAGTESLALNLSLYPKLLQMR
jgi:hypothetical protein